MPIEVLRNRDWSGRLTSMCLSPSLLSKKKNGYTWGFLILLPREPKGGSCDGELHRNALISMVPAHTGDWDRIYHGRGREHFLQRFSFPENANF